MKKKGFTLIELLAVIVILGLLMAIAIPSVTKYITQSRKKTLTTTIGNYMSALTTQVNDMEYIFTESNTIYAVPIECIALERGGTDPFGKWYQANDSYWAYVLVQYDDSTSSYTYGFTFKDSAGYGLYPTSTEELSEGGSQINTDLTLTRPISGKVTNITLVENWKGFELDNNTKLIVLEAESEGLVGDGKITCTLSQKGNNYELVEKEKSEKYKGGKEVCFGTECFYIIDSDNTTVTLLAQHRINPSINNPIQNANASGTPFASTTYWYSQYNTVKDEYGGKHPAYIYDSNCYLYSYLEAYKKYLIENTDLDEVIVTLISYEQAEQAKTKYGQQILNRGYTWWTGSTSMGNNQYNLSTDGRFEIAGWITEEHSVLPMIIVSKSYVR